MKCPNLTEMFGDRYYVNVEESHKAERGTEIKRSVDPWLLILPGKYGHCFPWSESRLAVSVDGHPIIAGRVSKLPCVQAEQDGDFGELTASFRCEDFDTIDEIVRFRRRMVLSDAERERRRQLITSVRPVKNAVQEPKEPRSRRSGCLHSSEAEIGR